MVDSTDMTSYITGGTDFEKTTNTHKVTTYGNDSNAYNPGLNDGTYKIEFTYDDTAMTGPRAKLNTIYAANAAVEIIRRPEGTGSSLPEDTFNAILTKMTDSAPVDDMISVMTEWQITGDVDTTAQAA